jgi:hypothetical protein
MKNDRPGVTKADLQQFIAGHARANEVMAEERRQRLARLTVEEARREYDSLCAVWEANPHRGDTGRLEARRLAFLVERRRWFDRLAGREKNP